MTSYRGNARTYLSVRRAKGVELVQTSTDADAVVLMVVGTRRNSRGSI
jgi:hypothetical protein